MTHNSSMCATCDASLGAAFPTAHCLREWTTRFKDPIPAGFGFILDQVVVTLYGAWPCEYPVAHSNDTLPIALVTINSVLVGEAALPRRNVSCLCRNCASPLVIVGAADSRLWQNTYFSTTNALQVSLTSQRLVCLSAVDVRLHYSAPTNVVVYYTPMAGPITGQTNVTVLGDFEPGTRYNCFFGRVSSIAMPLESGNGTSVFQVACLSPLSITDGAVRFSVEAQPAQTGDVSAPAPAKLAKRAGGVQMVNKFRYYKRPTFDSFAPQSGPAQGGFAVNITGANFIEFDNYLYCMFGEASVAATFLSNTTVQCTAPPGTAGSVHLTYSQNNQQFDSVGTFTYLEALTPDSLNLSYWQVGLIAGGAALLVLILAGIFVFYSCSKRRFTVLHSVGPDGQVEQRTINVAEIQLLQRIGKGSFAEVFRASWRGSEIAVKKLPARAVDEEARAAFESEAALMSRLRHPNCLLYIASCNVPPDIWILTEYMPLGSLYQVLHDAELPLNWDVLLSMLSDTAKGVAYLHGHDPVILHRDLKSHNILVNEHWQAKVCDFGLSRLAVETHTMTACGTPCWTAPEVLRNQRYCASADVYSYGIIAWECVTRADPYGIMPPFQVIFAVGTQGARPEIPKDCPPEMTSLIVSCWHEQPDERPTFTAITERIGGIMAILCTGEALPPTRLRNSRVSSLSNSGLELADPSAGHKSGSQSLPFADLEENNRADADADDDDDDDDANNDERGPLIARTRRDK
jgi:serine/threonine protein kinase